MPACHAGDRRFESGRVRHHRISLRPVRPPGRGVLLSAGSIRAVRRGPLLVVIGLLAIAVVLPITGGELGFGSASASPSAPATRPSGAPSPSTGTDTSSGATASPSAAPASPSASPSATAVAPGPPEEIAIVPVTQYRSTATATSRKEVADVLAGKSTRYEALELVSGETDEILAALGA